MLEWFDTLYEDPGYLAELSDWLYENRMDGLRWAVQGMVSRKLVLVEDTRRNKKGEMDLFVHTGWFGKRLSGFHCFLAGNDLADVGEHESSSDDLSVVAYWSKTADLRLREYRRMTVFANPLDALTYFVAQNAKYVGEGVGPCMTVKSP